MILLPNEYFAPVRIDAAKTLFRIRVSVDCVEYAQKDSPRGHGPSQELHGFFSFSMGGTAAPTPVIGFSAEPTAHPEDSPYRT